MGMSTPSESSPTDAHLNDLATRTTLEDSGGFIMVRIPDFETLSDPERITVLKKAQELQRKRPCGTDDLASRLRDLTPPIDSEEELEEARALEVRARKELEDDGCPPCYPPNLEFPLRNPPDQYQMIIQYWKSIDDVVLCYQKLDWEKFRRLQARVRCRNRPFSIFMDEVRDRRQRHGLSGDVRLLLDPEQQSRLENWIEFQNRHLKRLEQFEEERDKLKQGLDDAQKLTGDKNTTRPKFGPTRPETLKRRLEVIERDLKWHHVLLHWIEQRRLAMDPGHPKPAKGDHGDQYAATKTVRKTSGPGRRIKPTEAPSVLGKVRVTKVKSNERKTRNRRTEKRRLPELEPSVQKLDVLLQSSTSQASKHPEMKPRRTKIDRPLRKTHPQSMSKATWFAGIRARSPSGPRRRGAEQTQSPKRARKPTPQRAQFAPTFITRSGRISGPPTRWAPESGAFRRNFPHAAVIDNTA